MQGRLAQLEAELARRIAPILRDVPTSLFEELVHLVASIQYERESMRYRRPADKEPVGELAIGDEISNDETR